MWTNALSVATMLCFAWLPALQAADKASFAAPHLEAHGIRVHTPGNDGFAAALQRSFALNPPDLGPIGPFCLLMENRSSSIVVAYTIRYDMVFPEGHRAASVSRRSNLGPALSSHGLPSGSAALISPDGVQFSPKAPGTAGMFSAGGGSVSNRIAASSSLTVSVDSILFADGTFVGEDRSRTYEYLADQVAVELRISRMLLEAPEDADLRALLESSKAPRHNDVTFIEGVHERNALNAYLSSFGFSGRDGVLRNARKASEYYRALNLRKATM